MIELLQDQALQLSTEIRRLSHELHPGLLRHAGLVAALRQHCRELSDAGLLDVTLDAPVDLPPPSVDISFCLYRIAQEALRNAIRHAGPCQARVVLELRGKSLMLTVTDNGRGSDIAGRRAEGGVGLASMEERIHAVGRIVFQIQVKNWGFEVAVKIQLKGANHAPPARYSRR